MLSSVYQLSTADNAVASAKDSGNRLYWRAEKKRLDAEQLRDGILMSAGNLDDAIGGPSADLTPAYLRRTVYGKVSRYKLDEYLQLFDFPSPSISAEKRFVTTVPLQRLFLMNSDFMQVESEELAKRVANESDNRSRINRAYRYVFGRDASEEEITLGLEYLRSEPLLEYEERKAKPPTPAPGGRRGGRGAPGQSPQGQAPAQTTAETPAATDAPAATGSGPDTTAVPPVPGPEKPPDKTEAAKPAPMPENAGDAVAAAPVPPSDAEPAADGMMGMGMMGGMGRRGANAGPPEMKYDVTVWGRYVKILFSSSEFLFIN
jgi:hypothetical protein